MPWQDVLAVGQFSPPRDPAVDGAALGTRRQEPTSPRDLCRRPSRNGGRDDGRTTDCRYWLPRCVRHVRTSPCRRCAKCLRRCANRRPADGRRGTRPLSRRSLIGRNDWGLRLRVRRQPLSAAAIKLVPRHGRQMTARAGEWQPSSSAAAQFSPLVHDVGTGGVSDHIFALFHLLSQSLVPHLRDFTYRQ